MHLPPKYQSYNNSTNCHSCSRPVCYLYNPLDFYFHINTPHRLYVDYKSKFRTWEQERQRKEDEEVERTCTFKPQTNLSNSKRPPTPTRSSTPSTASAYSKDTSPPKNSYPFTPVVNKINTNILHKQFPLV
jgi:hypothetical protein